MTCCSPSRRREGVGGRAGRLTETVAYGFALPRPLPPAGEEKNKEANKISSPAAHIV